MINPEATILGNVGNALGGSLGCTATVEGSAPADDNGVLTLADAA